MLFDVAKLGKTPFLADHVFESHRFVQHHHEDEDLQVRVVRLHESSNCHTRLFNSGIVVDGDRSRKRDDDCVEEAVQKLVVRMSRVEEDVVQNCFGLVDFAPCRLEAFDVSLI